MRVGNWQYNKDVPVSSRLSNRDRNQQSFNINMIRAKFKCTSKDADGNALLEAVMSGSPENEEFFKYTPFGRLQLGIVNPPAFDQLEEGKDYYIDISPAE